MRVLYISSSHFFDMDLSLTRSLKGKCELFYLLDVPPQARNFTALSLNGDKRSAGIYDASDFCELSKWEEYLDISKMSVIYRTSLKTVSTSNLKLQYDITAFINKVKPDIIHCSSFLNPRFILFLLLNRRKIVVTVHDPFPHSGESNSKTERKRQLTYSNIKNIILLNNAQKEGFIKSGHEDKKVFVSSLGVYEYLNSYKVYNRPSRVFKILFFGRISKYKGVEYLLQAARLLKEQGISDFEVIIAGSGTYWFDVSEFREIKEIKIINRFIPNNELVKLISESSVVVCPYIDATQSGVIMSAYALKKPVIATNVGGLVEMVEDEVTGLLIEPGSSQTILDAILYLKGNPEVLLKMQTNIEVNYFRSGKSWNTITDGLIEIYKQILD